MRAPPPPRRSKSRLAAYCVVRLRQLLSCYRLRKRWHLHKLHKIHRRGDVAVSPISGIRAEDMMNLPSSLHLKENRKKPLLIAQFPKGCSKSPRVRVLQRNRLSKLMISKRKYKLKSFDVDAARRLRVREDGTHPCANTVGSIKKMASKNADVRVIYHEANVIKCSNILYPSRADLQSPELFEFAPNRSIRIKDYPSLRRGAPSALHVVGDISGSEAQAPSVKNVTPRLTQQAEFDASTFKYIGVKSKTEQLIKRKVKVSEYFGMPIISYSRLVPVEDSQAHKNTLSWFYHVELNEEPLQKGLTKFK